MPASNRLSRTQQRILDLLNSGFSGSSIEIAQRMGADSSCPSVQRRPYRLVNPALLQLTGQGLIIRYRYGRGFHYRALLQQEVIQTVAINRTFGIEFEILVPYNLVPNGDAQQWLASQLRARGINIQAEGYNHAIRSHWKVVMDSSVNAMGYYGMEVVSPLLTGERGEENVREVCGALQAIGCVVNRSCGTHVHQGAADYSPVQRQQIWNAYATVEPLIDSVMPPSRRNGNMYCMTCRGRDIDTTRYVKLNASRVQGRHQTVEFRQHGGTTEASKILPWVRFTRAMMEVARETTGAASLAASPNLSVLLERLNLSETDKAFFLARAARFNQNAVAA